MKKFKLITTALSTGVCAFSAPLMLLTSCGKDNYSSISFVIKETILENFRNITKCHFCLWDEYEAFDYIKKKMNEALDVTKPNGEDQWSIFPEVLEKREINAPWDQLKNTGDEPDTKYYLHDGSVWDKASQDHPDWTKGKTYGNTWYDIPASKGYENVPTIIMIAHVDSDMSFANAQAKHDWNMRSKDKEGAIQIKEDVEMELMESVDHLTSLGADDALGVCELISLAQHRNQFYHGKIRCLFTADEAGPTDNFQDGLSFLRLSQDDTFLQTYFDNVWSKAGGTMDELKKYLAPSKPFLDDNGKPIKNIMATGAVQQKTIYTSSAGIHKCILSKSDVPAADKDGEKVVKEYVREGLKNNSDYKYQYTFEVSGFKGGSTGFDIDKGRGSAIELLGKILQTQETNILINNFDSGTNTEYQISKYASATVTFPTQYVDPIHKKGGEISPDDVYGIIKDKVDTLKESYLTDHPGENKDIQIKITPRAKGWTGEGHITEFEYDYGLVPVTSNKLLDLLMSIKVGPVDRFPDTHAVRSSINVGPVVFKKNAEGNKYTFNLDMVVRSASYVYMDWCQSLMHKAAVDIAEQILPPCATPEQKEIELEKILHHSDNDVWEKAENNPLLDLTDRAFKFFLYKSTHSDRHTWVSVASLISMFYNDPSLKGEAPNMVQFGCEIYDAHTVAETIDLSSVNSALRSTLYVLDHIREMKD